MSVPDPAAPVRTRAEIASAIRAFTPVQWVRLRKVAAYYAALGRLIEAEDLLQEAFRRALDGERKCPVTVDVVRFLAEAIRSIIDGELKKAKRRPVLVPLPAPGDPDPDDPTTKVPEPADPAPNAEERLEAREEEALRQRQRQQVIDLFADDLAGQVIVEGIMEGGMKGEDLRALTDLDQTAYESKRRLIRRRIERFLRGPKP